MARPPAKISRGTNTPSFENKVAPRVTRAKAILPGATVGMLGSGQLGRMFALVARRMGYRVHTFSPSQNSPTGQIAEQEIASPYEDLDAARRFAQSVEVVTYEFENIPYETVKAVSEHAPVRPAPEVLRTTQHRLREKTFLAGAGLPVTPFRAVRSSEDLSRALEELGCPAILKTAGFGYDGKGQRKITSREQAADACAALRGQEGILEAFVDFQCELSVIAARGSDGAFLSYDVFQNEHQNHILDVTVSPAALKPRTARHAVEIARAVFEALHVVGVLCVEMFLTKKGGLLINELAPRPHNSGHLTIDACATSQFEQQLRAVCGLSLGSPRLLGPAAMANLLGDLWQKGEPQWERALKYPEVKLHLYGKAEAQPGRKMGHLTALARSAEEARRLVIAARDALRP